MPQLSDIVMIIKELRDININAVNSTNHYKATKSLFAAMNLIQVDGAADELLPAIVGALKNYYQVRVEQSLANDLARADALLELLQEVASDDEAFKGQNDYWLTTLCSALYVAHAELSEENTVKTPQEVLVGGIQESIQFLRQQGPKRYAKQITALDTLRQSVEKADSNNTPAMTKFTHKYVNIMTSARDSGPKRLINAFNHFIQSVCDAMRQAFKQVSFFVMKGTFFPPKPAEEGNKDSVKLAPIPQIK